MEEKEGKGAADGEMVAEPGVAINDPPELFPRSSEYSSSCSVGGGSRRCDDFKFIEDAEVKKNKKGISFLGRARRRTKQERDELELRRVVRQSSWSSDGSPGDGYDVGT